MAVTNSSAANLESTRNMKHMGNSSPPKSSPLTMSSTDFLQSSSYTVSYTFETFLRGTNNCSSSSSGLSVTEPDLYSATKMKNHTYQQPHIPQNARSYFWISFSKIYQRGYNTLLRSRKTGKTDPYDMQTGGELQGRKTFCASCCASLIAGSRRAFLCVDCVCLFGVLSEMHEVRTFAPCKAFLLHIFFFVA